jgi:hypothetical protein
VLGSSMGCIAVEKNIFVELLEIATIIDREDVD